VDLRKLRNGDWIALAGGVALIVSLFLPWYGAGGVTANGWQSLTVIDVILFICALFGVAQWFFAAQQPTPAVPLAAAGLGVWTGLLAILLTVIRLIDSPADGLSVQYGVFVALIASITLFAGAWRSLGDERIRMPDGRWSRPAGGEIPADVEVKTLRPSRPETAAHESP
jgi:ABC-type xylose transport system permease subunit